jgi:hypothetical protein
MRAHAKLAMAAALLAGCAYDVYGTGTGRGHVDGLVGGAGITLPESVAFPVSGTNPYTAVIMGDLVGLATTLEAGKLGAGGTYLALAFAGAPKAGDLYNIDANGGDATGIFLRLDAGCAPVAANSGLVTAGVIGFDSGSCLDDTHLTGGFSVDVVVADDPSKDATKGKKYTITGAFAAACIASGINFTQQTVTCQ